MPIIQTGMGSISVLKINRTKASVPQGFNYQAIARGSNNKEIINTDLQVKISILTDTIGFYLTDGGTYLWEEQQNVTTNSLGMFTLVLGNPKAVKTLGSASSFNAIVKRLTTRYNGKKIPLYKFPNRIMCYFCKRGIGRHIIPCFH
jgi:hypothetical protein